jgi:hypothetical protein
MTKHIVHCREGGKVIIDGDAVEVHLDGPIKITRKHWVRYFSPADEVRRTVLCSGYTARIEDMLKEAFAAVPMTVYHERESQP